ncbi:MAG: TolB family protein [Aggregatilineales bacterium]
MRTVFRPGFHKHQTFALVNRALRWAVFGFVVLVAACSPPPPTATLTPAKTFTPSVSATPSPIPPTLPPGVTPTITLTPSLTPTPSLVPSNTPFTVTGSGALVLRLPDSSSETITTLEFSPDAKTLLVTLNDGLNPHVARLTWDTSGAHFIRLSDLALDQPTYSPDGNQIAFAQTLYSPNSRLDANGNSAIVFSGLLMGDGNGSNRRNLTPSDGGFNPAWSPDGKQLAYLRPAAGQCNDPKATELPGSCFSLILFDMAKQTPRVVYTAPYLAGLPIWSPDGQKLLLQESGEVGTAVGVFDLATSRFTFLIPNDNTPDSAGGITGAVWTPDSQAVIYATLTNELWRQPITAVTPTQLTANGGNPYWPRGSRWLYYLVSSPAADSTTTQQVWRLDPKNPQPAPVLTTPLTCDRVAWSTAADLLACAGPVDNQPAITLYSLPNPS